MIVEKPRGGGGGEGGGVVVWMWPFVAFTDRRTSGKEKKDFMETSALCLPQLQQHSTGASLAVCSLWLKTGCDRLREWASVAPDSELAESQRGAAAQFHLTEEENKRNKLTFTSSRVGERNDQTACQNTESENNSYHRINGNSKIISSDLIRRNRWRKSEVEIRTGRRSNRRRKNWHTWAFVTSVVPPHHHAKSRERFEMFMISRNQFVRVHDLPQ